MKTTYLLIAVALALTSCGKPPKNDKEVHVDSELEHYALEFEQEMGVATSHISMKFGELTGNEMGLCTSWTNGDRDITIDKEYWSDLDDLAKEELMYHELGHCAMDLDHDATLVLDPSTNAQIEASIMKPYFFGNDYNWDTYRDSYKTALRTRGRLSF